VGRRIFRFGETRKERRHHEARSSPCILPADPRRAPSNRILPKRHEIFFMYEYMYV
jgi:hypothetical protein